MTEQLQKGKQEGLNKMRTPRPVSFLLFLFAGLLVSCATRPPPLLPWGKASQEEAVPDGTDSGPSSRPLPPLIDQLVRRVKDNDPGLEKYFLQDQEGTISVKAEAEGFEILYDLANARPAGASRWEVDFSVGQAGGGESWQDTLLWKIPHDESGILLSLDDDYEDQWRGSFDLLDRYGVKITFFVIGGPSPFVPRP
jgi:hypothetical protein